MTQTILITGVSGHLGSGVLDHLLKTVPAARLIAMARDPKKIERYAAMGVTIRQGDYADPTSLDKAFTGVDTLLLIPTADVGLARPGHHKNAVDAAKRAGVQHLLYVGVIHHDEAGHGPIISHHQHTEKHIAASGIPHTFIRNGMYLDVVPGLIGDAVNSGKLYYTAMPKGLSFAARSDLAQAIAKIIVTPASHGKPQELSLPQATTFSDVATALSTVTETPVQYVEISLPAFIERLNTAGLPAHVAEFMTDMSRAMGDGVVLAPSNNLTELLGREPIGVEAFLRSALQPVTA